MCAPSRWKQAPLKPLPYREVQRRLEAAGFTLVSQKGSHMKFVKQSDAGVRTVMVFSRRNRSRL
jgi:predicted RNA binding protein YcfA (HicA-like mRNA interferase family)